MEDSMSATLDPARILHELSEVWKSLGQEEEHGVLRACSMTLILLVDDAQNAAAAGETIADLMHNHPSRAIVIRMRPGETGPVVESRVFAACWMPFGRRQQICCEQVEITTSPSSLAEVIPVLLGLTVADLPVVLICDDPALCVLPGFSDLLPLASKVVFDSRNAADAGAMLRLIASSGSAGRTVADLAWAGLTRWREPIAREFDVPGMTDLLPGVR